MSLPPCSTDTVTELYRIKYKVPFHIHTLKWKWKEFQKESSDFACLVRSYLKNEHGRCTWLKVQLHEWMKNDMVSFLKHLGMRFSLCWDWLWLLRKMVLDFRGNVNTNRFFTICLNSSQKNILRKREAL